jgi:phosphopantothenoylcysteine decarboxylase / phosphopantothenate---cysteine ligase
MTLLKNKKFLITSGPTWVPIDDMRVISNRSSGQLGTLIAAKAVKVGAKVTLLEGPFAFEKFAARLNKELKKNYDVVVHAVAVSDYQLKKPFSQKIRSEKKMLTLKLIPTPKLIQTIKKKLPHTFLVGFKFETHLSATRAQKCAFGLIKTADCDLVIANTLRGTRYKGFIVNKRCQILAKADSRSKMAEKIVKSLKLLNKK